MICGTGYKQKLRDRDESACWAAYSLNEDQRRGWLQQKNELHFLWKVSELGEGSLSAPPEKHDDAFLDQKSLLFASSRIESETQYEGVDTNNLETVRCNHSKKASES